MLFKLKKATKRRAPLRRRRVYRPRVALAVRTTNPSPVFTETYRLPENSVEPNTGGNFLFSMSQVPQLAQYVNLYSKYRILKATIMLLPSYGEQDQNAGEYNSGNSVYSHGMSRFAWAIQDTPNTALPASEDDILKMNGCKIKPVRHKLPLGCRPVPNLKDSNGAQLTIRGKYINFIGGTNPELPHYGISYWYTQPNLGQQALLNNQLFAYVKLTFQLSDPR